MTIAEVKALTEKYVAGECSPEEIALLETWYAEHNEGKPLGLEPERVEMATDRVWARILETTAERPMVRLWPRIAAAASILLILSAGGYFLWHKPQPAQQMAQVQPHDIAPGRKQATLTLANGQKIILTKGLNGKLAQQGQTLIRVNGGSDLTYTSQKGTADEPIAYNTLTTAKGEKSPYPLVLADGTKIWLNAASSVTFPTAFKNGERLVKITGEAYFEVVHNVAHPFKVQVADQVIEDVGTHFNIKAYTDEPAITTTLLEGAVKVSRSAQVVNLSPGQQATVRHDQLTLVPEADTRLAMGWREGYFRFKDAGINEFMRQLARWYDVEVVYEGKSPDFSFTGSLREDINASQALQVLDIFKVHHKIDGKKIIITP